MAKNDKEFLYVGHYIDENGNYILKVGTTNNLERRRKEHTRNYRKSPVHKLSQNGEFLYDWHLKLSKYNTLRYEDKTRQNWQDLGIGTYIRNDRFFCANKPETVQIKIRKTYTITLAQRKKKPTKNFEDKLY